MAAPVCIVIVNVVGPVCVGGSIAASVGRPEAVIVIGPVKPPVGVTVKV